MSEQYGILKRILTDRPIAFHPSLARVLGGIGEALLLQQLAYWSDKGENPEWIYKTQAELEEETTLTRTQQENARRNLRRLGVVEEQKKGLPAKLYYRVDWGTLFALLEDSTKDAGNLQPRMRVSRNPGREEPAGKPARKPQPLLGTESTSEKTDKDFEHSKGNARIVEKYDDVRLALLPYAQDLARELNDQAPLAATTTRLVNLYRASGLELDTFIDRLLAARAITQERTASIRTRAEGLGSKPKVQYFMAVLEDLTGREAS
jgi:hypothetical protein